MGINLTSESLWGSTVITYNRCLAWHLVLGWTIINCHLDRCKRGSILAILCGSPNRPSVKVCSFPLLAPPPSQESCQNWSFQRGAADHFIRFSRDGLKVPDRLLEKGHFWARKNTTELPIPFSTCKNKNVDIMGMNPWVQFKCTPIIASA